MDLHKDDIVACDVMFFSNHVPGYSRTRLVVTIAAASPSARGQDAPINAVDAAGIWQERVFQSTLAVWRVCSPSCPYSRFPEDVVFCL